MFLEHLREIISEAQQNLELDDSSSEEIIFVMDENLPKPVSTPVSKPVSRHRRGKSRHVSRRSSVVTPTIVAATMKKQQALTFSASDDDDDFISASQPEKIKGKPSRRKSKSTEKLVSTPGRRGVSRDDFNDTLVSTPLIATTTACNSGRKRLRIENDESSKEEPPTKTRKKSNPEVDKSVHGSRTKANSEVPTASYSYSANSRAKSSGKSRDKGASLPGRKKKKRSNVLTGICSSLKNADELPMSKIFTEAMSTKFVGRTNFPLIYLTRGDTSDITEHQTRLRRAYHIRSLKKSMKAMPGGMVTREPFIVHIIIDENLNEDEYESIKQILTNICTLQQDGTESDIVLQVIELKAKLKVWCDAGSVILLSIGGSHSNEACHELMIESISFDNTLQAECIFLFGLTKKEEKEIGLMVNKVQETHLKVDLGDKIEIICAAMKENENLGDDGKLTPEAKANLWQNLEYDPTNKKHQTKELSRPYNPMFVACGTLNEDSKEWIIPLASSGVLSVSAFKQITEKFINWKKFNEFGKAVLAGEIKKPNFSDFILQMKTEEKFKESIWSIYETDDQLFDESLELDADILFDQMNEFQTLTPIMARHISGIQRSTSVYKQPLFVEEISSVLKAYLNYDDQPGTQSPDAFVIKNGENQTSHHNFKKSDAVKAVNLFQQNPRRAEEIGLVIVDPPFGLTKNGWDIAWTTNYYDDLIKALSLYLPAANVVFILSDCQLKDVFTMLDKHRYKKSALLSWIKPNVKTGHGGFAYSSNPIVIANSESIFFLGSMGAKERRNVLCCPKVCNPFLHNDGILNETEKPIDLLRCIIHHHCPPLLSVLDLTCGSGSTAIAAASLGRNSHNFDIRQNQISGAKARIKLLFADPPTFQSPERCSLWNLSIDAPKKTKLKKRSPRVAKSDVAGPEYFIDREASSSGRELKSSQPEIVDDDDILTEGKEIELENPKSGELACECCYKGAVKGKAFINCEFCLCVIHPFCYIMHIKRHCDRVSSKQIKEVEAKYWKQSGVEDVKSARKLVDIIESSDSDDGFDSEPLITKKDASKIREIVIDAEPITESEKKVPTKKESDSTDDATDDATGAATDDEDEVIDPIEKEEKKEKPELQADLINDSNESSGSQDDDEEEITDQNDKEEKKEIQDDSMDTSA